LRDLISYDINDVRVMYSGENDATGFAYGIDAYLHGEFVPGTENWISYSFLISKEKLLDSNKGYVSRPSERRHQLGIYMEDQMIRFPSSKCHLRIIYGSGYPIKNGTDRLPMYARFDLGLTQKLKWGNHAVFIFREEVLNFFDHVNVLGYSELFGIEVTHYLSGRIFNIGFRIEFKK